MDKPLRSWECCLPGNVPSAPSLLQGGLNEPDPGSLPTLACGLIGALTLGRIHGVASRAEGKMARALAGIPDDRDRDRWKEELRQTLLEFEGRPVKQFRESKQLVRAAERLVEVYAPSPAQCGLGSQATAEDSETQVTIEVGAAPLTRLNRGAVVEAMENLSYRERASWSSATA